MEKAKPVQTVQQKAARFERNGWIGLAITLAICLLIYLLLGAP
jgi:hypothetical protein